MVLSLPMRVVLEESTTFLCDLAEIVSRRYPPGGTGRHQAPSLRRSLRRRRRARHSGSASLLDEINRP
jgi:hypothetical protein